MLPDLLAPKLKIVIVGTAAGNRSAQRQAYYAGSGNRFWKTLFQVGLTPRELVPHEFPLLLDYAIGLTDLVKGKSGMDHVLAEADFDRDGLEAKIREYRPQVVCLHGKRAAQAYFGRRKVEYGLQPDNGIIGTRFFVVPQTSGANGHWNRLVGWWKELARLTKAERNRAVPMDKVNLSAKQIDALRDWAERTPFVGTLWLFGSRARGEAGSDSDVDLAVELTMPSNLYDEQYREVIYDLLPRNWPAELQCLIRMIVQLVHFEGPNKSPTVFAGLSQSSIVLFQREPEHI